MKPLSPRPFDSPLLHTVRSVGVVAYILVRWTCAALARRLRVASPR
jgi:hypothetical protein